jgi:predicted Zn-dependent protease with MMP-like domain
MTRERFQSLVEQAFSTIPLQFRDALKNIAIVVEDVPSAVDLAAAGVDPPDTLLGLYQGTPLTERGWSDGGRLPDKITIYQRPIEEASDDEDDLIVAVGETLIHEIGHYFGMSEEQIEAIEDDYWARESDVDDAPDASEDGDPE